MRLIFVLCICISTLSFAQKNGVKYSLSNLPVFLDQKGDTFTHALIGGLNQPQFQAVDLNNDGKKDMVIYDRSGGVFLTFINNGTNDLSKFRYMPAYQNCFPKVKKGWMLLVDYDVDGREDLWASIDYKVVLFKNITSKTDNSVKFERVSTQLKAYKYSGIPILDTVNFSVNSNNIPAIADIDNDGDIDFLTSDANQGTVALYRNMSNEFNLPLHPPVFDLADFCWGYFRDSSTIGIKKFDCSHKAYRKKHPGGTALLLLDDDHDGDLDLLLGNSDAKNIMFLKNGKSDWSSKFDSIISYDAYWPSKSEGVNINSFPAAFLIDANMDGVKDILVAPNAVESKSPIEQTKQVWYYKNRGTSSKPDFQLEKKNYFTDEIIDHGEYTDPILYDIDNDEDLDLLIASNGDNAITHNRAFRIFLYRNIGTINSPIFRLENEDLWNLSLDSIEYLSLAIGDISGDGKPDLVTGSRLGTLSFYQNIGTTNNWAFSKPVKDYQSLGNGVFITPQLIDLNKDGLLDLLIGNCGGNFNYYKNSGTKTNPIYKLVDDTLGNFITNEFINELSPPDYWNTGNASGEICDLDGDGTYEMIFGGEEGRLRMMRFDSYLQTKYTEDTSLYFDSSLMKFTSFDCGTNSHPTAGDLNNDGILDLIIGNDRGGINFLLGQRNTIGIQKIIKNSRPSVFPNPCSEPWITILKNSTEAMDFELIDVRGQTLLKGNSSAGTLNHKLDISHLKNGYYSIKTLSKNKEQYFIPIILLDR